ncbi:hypothetical protein DKG75_10945 [Zavarzinia compransoris]|uniref:Uncharacterized protein n=1 Tax=Zavarzinia compransoris TaxID=1264899 RepID=A0A317E0B7_9PROT|nr:hypothetical protein DKG75_10945 [Zavarzinia compransoris]
MKFRVQIKVFHGRDRILTEFRIPGTARKGDVAYPSVEPNLDLSDLLPIGIEFAPQIHWKIRG